MWIIAFIMSMALGAAVAAAFDCAGVTLPSSSVICSDPELMQLADERQEAFNEARARVGEDRFPQLWEDQKAWVRSYASACGVPADSPAPIPVPTSVVACFKQAALARIAYLRGYGINSNVATAGSKPSETWSPVDYDPFAKPAAEPTDHVSLVEKDGIYTVPVLINGILPLQFVLDSGAADVSLPADVFLTLLRTGTITGNDYIGSGQYRLADGSTVQSDKFYIHELRVGNHFLQHIVASIEDVKSPLLLGQSFLKRFASVQIDNTQHVLVLGPVHSDAVRSDVRFPSDLVPITPKPNQPAPMPEVIDLSKIKFVEITQPYARIDPSEWKMTITNFGSQTISEITIGFTSYDRSSCPRSPEAYDGVKRIRVSLPPSDSTTVTETLGSQAKWFCILAAR
jgi:predicted aspartyl protease